MTTRRGLVRVLMVLFTPGATPQGDVRVQSFCVGPATAKLV